MFKLKFGLLFSLCFAIFPNGLAENWRLDSRFKSLDIVEMIQHNYPF